MRERCRRGTPQLHGRGVAGRRRVEERTEQVEALGVPAALAAENTHGGALLFRRHVPCKDAVHVLLYSGALRRQRKP